MAPIQRSTARTLGAITLSLLTMAVLAGGCSSSPSDADGLASAAESTTTIAASADDTSSTSAAPEASTTVAPESTTTETTAAPSNEVVVGSGVIVTEDRAVAGFHALDLRGFGSVELDITTGETLQVEADDNVIGLVHTEVVAGRLVIDVVRDRSVQDATVRIRIGALQLDEITLDGSADLVVRGLVNERLSVDLEGSGDIDLSGSSTELDIAVDGSGEVMAVGLAAERGSVRLEGSGDVEVAVSSTLSVTLDGSGDVTYHGAPALTTEIDGSGEVEPA